MGAQGVYLPRRPNLRDILANTSPPPWTLAAFMAYLSNNHCLETLDAETAGEQDLPAGPKSAAFPQAPKKCKEAAGKGRKD
jgi:hypothetical protein